VLITGATSGIGQATARLLGEKGYKLILCGRRSERLDEIQKTVAGKTNVQALCFDISKPAQIETAFHSIPESFKPIDVLINNAGNAHGLDPIHEGKWEDWEAMIDINVKGLLYITRLVANQMVRQKKGHIINIGSIAGLEAYPQGNVYCATKAAVAMLGKTMLMDLYEHNIKVSTIQPGLVETEFSLVRFKGDTERARKVYQGYQPLQPSDIAHLILYMLEAPDHVNLSEVVILPKAQAAARLVHKNIVQD